MQLRSDKHQKEGEGQINSTTEKTNKQTNRKDKHLVGTATGEAGRSADAKTVKPKVENVWFPPSYYTLYNAVKKGVQSVKLGYAAVS